MSLLLESIYLKDGKFRNLAYHEARMRNSSHVLFRDFAINLTDSFSRLAMPTCGLFKTRIIYDTEIQRVEYVPYTMRSTQSLKLINQNAISYSHKFIDRSNLENLFEQRAAADDILIVRDGLITDTHYANVIFKKDEQWFTPESYLLKGTMRQSLLDAGIIKEAPIDIDNYKSYQSVKLISAMVGMESPEIPVTSIF